MQGFLVRKFPGFQILGVQLTDDRLVFKYLRAQILRRQETKEIRIAEIRSLVLWEADRVASTELTCQIELRDCEFSFGQFVPGFDEFLSALEDRFDQPDVDNRAWAGEKVYMIRDGAPVRRIF